MTRTAAHFIDTDVFGGAERAVLHLLTGLDRQRWRPVLLHHGGAGLRPLLDGAEAAGVERIAVPRVRGLRGAVHLLAVYRVLRALRPDVFHAHLSWPLACSGGILAAATAGVPAVLATVQLFGPLPRALTLPLQRRLVTRRVHRYVAVSEGVARRLREDLGVPGARVRVIRNGVELGPPAAPPPPGLLRAAAGAAPGRPLVLTLARLAEQKGLGDLLQAAARVPEATFVIAGGGPERAALEARAAALGLADRVRFLGHRADTRALLDGCDLFVLPSLYEGLPLTVLEAMAGGKPVVATAIPGTDEAVVDGETGLLVPPRDPAALAGAIRTLLGDPALARRLGAAGAERARRLFSSEALAHAVEAAYDEVLAERGAAPPRG